jgi:predicted Zn-dependent peptidase
MYEDNPQRNVWRTLMRLMYGDTPAGRTILGPAENIKKFKRDDFVKYRKDHYVANRTMVIVSGDVKEKDVLEEVKKKFKNIPTHKALSKDKVVKKQKTPAILIEDKKTDQTHMSFGFHSYDAHGKKLPALSMLATVLGGGMSSRLFHKMREVLGACYYVKTAHDDLTDHGYLAISTGINASRAVEVTKEILSECKKLTEELVPKEELNKAKEYYLGHLYMNLETTDSLAEFYLVQEVASGKLKTPQEIEKEIRAVTPENIRNVAREIFRNENLNLAAIGNIKDKAGVKKALKL